MFGSSLARIRRRVGLGFSVFSGLWVVWVLTPGIPVLSAPRASAVVKEAGLTLFEHDWKPGDSLAGGDGLGPVFNERSCVACHFQGGVGGGGRRQAQRGVLRGSSCSGSTGGDGRSAPQFRPLQGLPGKPDGAPRFLRRGARRPEDRRRLHESRYAISTRCVSTASTRQLCSERAGSTGSRARASCTRAGAGHSRRSARSSWPI